MWINYIPSKRMEKILNPNILWKLAGKLAWKIGKFCFAIFIDNTMLVEIIWDVCELIWDVPVDWKQK